MGISHARAPSARIIGSSEVAAAANRRTANSRCALPTETTKPFIAHPPEHFEAEECAGAVKRSFDASASHSCLLLEDARSKCRTEQREPVLEVQSFVHLTRSDGRSSSTSSARWLDIRPHTIRHELRPNGSSLAVHHAIPLITGDARPRYRTTYWATSRELSNSEPQERHERLWPKKYPTPIDQPIFVAKGRKPFTGDGLWQAFAAAREAAIEAKELAEPFTLHDIRAKSSSDTESLEAASARLGHASTATTERVYRRKPREVEPLR